MSAALFFKYYDQQVNELYEVVKQLEPLLSLLPSVIDRLSSLKVLHDGGNYSLFICSD